MHCSEWKVPCLPVKPWQIHLGVLVDKYAHDRILIECAKVSAGSRDDLLCSVGEIGGGDDLEATRGEHLARFLGVGAFEAHHDRHFHATFFTAVITPSAMRSQRTMPPKILTRIALTLRVRQDQFETQP